jgi:large subunit ribosomal protein L22
MSVSETPRSVRAQAKWVRVSPRKAQVVAKHIRGRTVPEARTVLAFTARAAAREIEKVLRSAVANAEANHGLVGDTLVVEAAYVDEGPTLKRWRPRARGRAARIRKRTCHITLLLAEPTNGTRPARAAAAVPPAAAEAGPAAGTAEKPRRRSRAAEATAESAAPAEAVPRADEPTTVQSERAAEAATETEAAAEPATQAEVATEPATEPEEAAGEPEPAVEPEAAAEEPAAEDKPKRTRRKKTEE